MPLSPFPFLALPLFLKRILQSPYLPSRPRIPGYAREHSIGFTHRHAGHIHALILEGVAESAEIGCCRLIVPTS
jgi:hypothetical protein